MSVGTRQVEAKFWLLAAPTSLLLQTESQPDVTSIPQVRVTSTIVVPDPPAHMIDLNAMSAQAAIAQGQESRRSADQPGRKGGG